MFLIRWFRGKKEEKEAKTAPCKVEVKEKLRYCTRRFAAYNTKVVEETK